MVAGGRFSSLFFIPANLRKFFIVYKMRNVFIKYIQQDGNKRGESDNIWYETALINALSGRSFVVFFSYWMFSLLQFLCRLQQKTKTRRRAGCKTVYRFFFYFFFFLFFMHFAMVGTGRWAIGFLQSLRFMKKDSHILAIHRDSVCWRIVVWCIFRI